MTMGDQRAAIKGQFRKVFLVPQAREECRTRLTSYRPKCVVRDEDASQNKLRVVREVPQVIRSEEDRYDSDYSGIRNSLYSHAFYGVKVLVARC